MEYWNSTPKYPIIWKRLLCQAGKSLYTTIRELVENSLDAAESIGALPLVSLTIEEFTEVEFNEHRGMDNRDVVDEGLFKVHNRAAIFE